jgi:hypothetical protein
MVIEDPARPTVKLGIWSAEQAAAEAQEMGTPIGVVDARSCVGLNYYQTMQGGVSIRMVCSGHTFVPQKGELIRSCRSGFDQLR